MSHDLPHPQSAAPLTRREREVTMLVARGLTNRQIADALVITEKTAEAHVSHILDKLGLSSRAQVAAWILSTSQRAIRVPEESLVFLAHDLTRPLAAIRAGAQVLERGAGPEDREQWRTGLAAIQANASRIAALLDEIVDGARAEAHRPLDRRRSQYA
jgi:DNA-binding CsgD family transcriptional regulator